MFTVEHVRMPLHRIKSDAELAGYGLVVVTVEQQFEHLPLARGIVGIACAMCHYLSPSQKTTPEPPGGQSACFSLVRGEIRCGSGSMPVIAFTSEYQITIQPRCSRCRRATRKGKQCLGRN